MLSSILLTALLAAGIQAAPTPAPSCDDQKVSTDQAFSLVAKVTKSAPNLDVNNWAVTAVHGGAGLNWQTLVQADPLDNNKATSYYQNGTMNGTEAGDVHNGDILVARGTSNIILSMRILPGRVPDDSNYAVSLDVGQGSPGNFIRYGGADAPVPYPHLVGNGDENGQFYVCSKPLFDPSKPIKQLFWRNQSGQTPDGCAEILLVPQCAGSVNNAQPPVASVESASCYAKAVDFQVPNKQNQQLEL